MLSFKIVKFKKDKFPLVVKHVLSITLFAVLLAVFLHPKRLKITTGKKINFL